MHPQMTVAIRSHKERGFFYAVAVENCDGFVERSDADVLEYGGTRVEAIKKVKQALKLKGYKICNLWEL